MMRISPRIEMILSLTPETETCCDIGTDHGYIALALARRGCRVIAADIRPKPLSAAAENIRRCGANNVELRLSNGFSAINEGEAECAVLAGMGGELISRIISDGIKATAALVLQPQSLIYELRDFLCKNGFVIEDEGLCREEGRFYVAMRVRRGNCRALTEAEKRIGPVLLEKKPPLLEKYIEDECRKLRLALKKIECTGAATENRAEYERLLGLYGGIISG